MWATLERFDCARLYHLSKLYRLSTRWHSCALTFKQTWTCEPVFVTSAKRLQNYSTQKNAGVKTIRVKACASSTLASKYRHYKFTLAFNLSIDRHCDVDIYILLCDWNECIALAITIHEANGRWKIIDAVIIIYEHKRNQNGRSLKHGDETFSRWSQWLWSMSFVTYSRSVIPQPATFHIIIWLSYLHRSIFIYIHIHNNHGIFHSRPGTQTTGYF